MAGKTNSNKPPTPPGTEIEFVKFIEIGEFEIVSDQSTFPGGETTEAKLMLRFVFVLPEKETEIVTPLVLISVGPGVL